VEAPLLSCILGKCRGTFFICFIGNSEGTSYETKGTACRRGTIFFNAILHNYDHGKEKMIEERKFNLNLKVCTFSETLIFTLKCPQTLEK